MEQLRKIKIELTKQYNILCDEHNDLLARQEVLEKELIKDNEFTSIFKTLKKEFDQKQNITVKDIQKEVSLEIEIEKLNNRIKILSQLIDILDVYISLSEQDIVILLNSLSSSKESINQKLLDILEKEYKELDILSTKKVLSKVFKTTRVPEKNKEILGLNIFFIIFISSFLVWHPIVQIIEKIIINTSLPLEIILSSLAIVNTYGIMKTYKFSKKSFQKRINAFTNLNNQLGNEVLPLENDNIEDEQLELEELINEKINKIITILLKQKECQTLINFTLEAQNPQLNLGEVISKETTFGFQHSKTTNEPNIETDTIIPQYEQPESGLRRKLTPPHNNQNK